MAEPPEIQRSSVEDAAVLPFQGELQSSQGFSSSVAGDQNDVFNNSENNGLQDAVDPGQQSAEHGFVAEFDTSNAVLAEELEFPVPEIEEQATGEVEEEKPINCSEKCALVIQVSDDVAAVHTSDLGNSEVYVGDVCAETHSQHHESESKTEKRPRRRGGKGRKGKEISKYYFSERKATGLQYSRKEMEALRYEQLDLQKKKWIEVFSGLAPLVAQEYEGLIEFKKVHQKDDAPSIHFDPRPKFLKSANLIEDCEKIAANHSEHLETMDCSAVEGDCSQDDDSDEDYSSIQKPAFAVRGEPDFDSGPPQDGLEYLRRVRWEAARIPKVKVAKVNKIKEQSVYMPQIPDIAKCPENLLPLKQWEDSFLADFSELRLKFSANSSIEVHSVHEEDVLVKMLESARSETVDGLTDDSYLSEGSGIVETSEEANPHCLANSSSGDLPTLSKILKMESAARTAMLRRRINLIEKMSKISQNDGLWLFALCATVDCPLHADTSAALRSLLRKLSSLRAAKTEIDNEVIMLNILVTISGRYFGQLEK